MCGFCLRFVIVVFPDHTHYFCVWPLFCYTLLCVLSIFAIISLGKREQVALLFIVVLASNGCYCSLVLPHGAVAWSALCDCGTSWSYSLTFLTMLTGRKTLILA